MFYALLADLIVAIHLAYVSYVVFGELAILVGWAMRWKWVRNFWFRVTHLVAIGFVAFETVIGMECPLTTWEANLRQWAGQPVEGGTFVGRLLHNLMFFSGPQWVFNVCYILIALLVAGTFILVPPTRGASSPARLRNAHAA